MVCLCTYSKYRSICQAIKTSSSLRDNVFCGFKKDFEESCIVTVEPPRANPSFLRLSMSELQICNGRTPSCIRNLRSSCAMTTKGIKGGISSKGSHRFVLGPVYRGGPVNSVVNPQLKRRNNIRIHLFDFNSLKRHVDIK